MKLHAAATLAALAALVSAPAFAAPTITLDFEGVAGYANPVGNYYDGGVDGMGRVGPNDGVSFTDTALALSNDASFQYFSNAPSGNTALFAFDASAYMNVSGGFSGALLFSYSSTSSALDAVDIYSGLNGSGTLLASASLIGNAQMGCSDTAYCRFDLTSVRFAGVGRSVSFGTVTQNAIFDDVTFTPAVPEPTTWALFGAGLLAVFAVRRRSSAAR